MIKTISDIEKEFDATYNLNYGDSTLMNDKIKQFIRKSIEEILDEITNIEPYCEYCDDHSAKKIKELINKLK